MSSLRENEPKGPKYRLNKGFIPLRLQARFRHSGRKRAALRANQGQAGFPAMTSDLDLNPTPEPVASHEPLRRRGSIVLVLLVAGALVAIAVALMTYFWQNRPQGCVHDF